MILFDTDVCIEILRGNQKVIEKRKDYTGNIAISFFSVAELFYGALKSSNPVKNKSLVEEFLLSIYILNSDIEISQKFAEIKSRLEKSGDRLSDADIFIAATSLTKCEKLITGNMKRFSRIENLMVENWIH